MFFTSLLGWWYGQGWSFFAQGIFHKLQDLAHHFSISLLLRTLFAPFRQISAQSSGDSLSARLQAFFDRSFSRLFGAVIRSFIIMAGLLSMFFELLGGCLLILIWPLLPILPICAITLSLMQVPHGLF